MISPDEAAFLAAISASPADDTARLVYADWLQENGREERAEFIRVQCELARMPDQRPCVAETGGKGCVCRRCVMVSREKDLLAVHRHEWFRWWHEFFGGVIAEGGMVLVPAEFERGFVERVTCTAADWVRHADAILAEHPVRGVTLAGVADEATLVALQDRLVGLGKVDAALDMAEGLLASRTPRDVAVAACRWIWPDITFDLDSLDLIAFSRGMMLTMSAGSVVRPGTPVYGDAAGVYRNAGSFESPVWERIDNAEFTPPAAE